MSLQTLGEMEEEEGSPFIKIYSKNRRVGIYQKYPFIVGYVVLKDNQEYLDCAGIRASLDPRLTEALTSEIEGAMDIVKKREAMVGPTEL